MNRHLLSLAIALIVPISFTLVACTKSDPPVKKLGSIRIAYATIPNGGLIHIALARGFFEAEGLDAIATPFAFGKLALGAVLAGEADLATAAETPILFAILDGTQISISAVIETSNMSMAMIMDTPTGIASPQDLIGKNIGVTKGTNGEYFLDSFLIANGIDKAAVTIVDMTPDRMFESMRNRSVSAVATWEPSLQAIYDGLAGKATKIYGQSIYTDFFCVVSRTDYARDNPLKMQAFLRALLRAEAFMRDSPQEASEIIAEYADIDAADISATLGKYRIEVGLDQSLLVVLEDETRWALSNRPNYMKPKPNYLDSIYADALSSIDPGRVRLIR